ncbi:hypothetical protein BAE44_0008376 [Dichanthelium oligosanthes]|uniref:Zonadhesin n=1 Tax=Dichanthelium oligosanthes TaxID=888268 RepID=A0A1E5VZS9_9POAL|nr:hypothetical protein BAE44_0008376 [Dichanthelium oligosanthes]
MQRRAGMADGEGRGRTLGAVIKEKDEELALFLEMRRREKERGAAADQLLLSGTAAVGDGMLQLDPPPPAVSELLYNLLTMKLFTFRLLTPPGTPLFPSLDVESKRSPSLLPFISSHNMFFQLANHPDPPSRTNLPLRTASSNSLNSTATTRRPSSSGGLTSNSSRPSTPTGRPALTATKGSRPSTPTSRATVPAKTGASAPRSSTPTSRSTLPSARSTTPSSRAVGPASRIPASSGRASAPASRSSTPTSRSSIPATRSTTPSSRPSIPAQSKPTSRASTPTRRPSAPSVQHSNLAAPARSSSISKPGSSMPKGSSPAKTTAPTPSRGSSPTVKSRPWKPSEMPGFSLDAPPNLRTSLPERPTSATRGRPGAPSSRSSSVESGPAARPRRQSCSPSRGRTLNGSVPSGSSMPAVRRSHLNGGDSVNPVQMGNKMVERVVHMRRLVPPKHDEQRSSLNSISGKSSNSPDSTGFGRSLSKKSLDMALRHMDIRRSIPNNLRPLMTSIPASSVHSARSGSTRSRPMSVSDSPLATSSNASSEPSVNNNLMCLDSIDIDDELCSDRAGPYGR